MKRIKSTVSYTVPHWNFCNEDNLDFGAVLTNATCRFCIKDKSGHRCVLYDQPLQVNNKLIAKVPACVDATAGFKSVIEPVEAPTVDPKVLIKQTIDLYDQTTKSLVDQGYPQPIAAATAKKHILGG